MTLTDMHYILVLILSLVYTTASKIMSVKDFNRHGGFFDIDDEFSAKKNMQNIMRNNLTSTIGLFQAKPDSNDHPYLYV